MPASLLACAPHPEPGAVVSKGDALAYAVAVGAAGQDCRDRLGRVREILGTHAR